MAGVDWARDMTARWVAALRAPGGDGVPLDEVIALVRIYLGLKARRVDGFALRTASANLARLPCQVHRGSAEGERHAMGAELTGRLRVSAWCRASRTLRPERRR